jgi:hypothetical protein
VLLPSLQRARRQAEVVACAANLHQIAIAFNNYLIDSRGMIFWRTEPIGLYGMDWYAYGGRETGNRYVGPQGNFFNSIIPRPLNKYVGSNVNLFKCPCDDDKSPWAALNSNFESCGNSYNFNASGHEDAVLPEGGLAGVKMARIRNASQTIAFLDAGLFHAADWHYRFRGNLCLADGHVVFTERPPEQSVEYLWVNTKLWN